MFKIVSAALSVLLTLLVFVPTLNAGASNECDCDNLPVIYIKGRSTIRENKDQPPVDDNHVLPHVEDGVIEGLAKELIPVFAKAYLTNNYDEYTNLLVSSFKDAYSNFALDENAEITNNAGILFRWSPSTIQDLHGVNPDAITDGFSAYDYIYRYF